MGVPSSDVVCLKKTHGEGAVESEPQGRSRHPGGNARVEQSGHIQYQVILSPPKVPQFRNPLGNTLNRPEETKQEAAGKRVHTVSARKKRRHRPYPGLNQQIDPGRGESLSKRPQGRGGHQKIPDGIQANDQNFFHLHQAMGGR
jgi:hypothetical protein